MNKYFKTLDSFQMYNNELLQTQSLNILSINIRSISSVTKFNKFKNMISSFNKLPSVICIQETWFQSELVNLYKIPGYSTVHCCRRDGYGGTSVYIRDQLEYNVELCESNLFIEAILISFNSKKVSGKPLKIMSFYRSQKCPESTFLEFVEKILNDVGSFPCLFIGDSNIDFLQPTTCQFLNSVIESYDFKNVHSFVTRPASKTSIDNVFSNLRLGLKVDVVECDLSDHNMVYCTLETNIKISDRRTMIQKRCDFGKMKRNIRDNLQPSSNVSDLISCISNAVSISTTEHRKVTQLSTEIAPWINANLQHLRGFKDKLLKKRRKRPGKAIEDMLKGISKVIKLASTECMEDYYHDKFVHTQNNPILLWEFLNQTLGRCKKSEIKLKDERGDYLRNDNDIANCLNRFFIDSVKTLRENINSEDLSYWNEFYSLTRHRNYFRLRHTNTTEVNDVIVHMEAKNSAGFDSISPKVVKECACEIVPNLVSIFNSSISLFLYPDVLKIQKIVPIPKEINAFSPDKYRPVSVLSTIDKIFEKILKQQFETFLNNENLLSENQFGFKKGCGTEEAVMNVVNYVCGSLDQGSNGVGGMFYDLTKAFDLVDHNILLQKLSFYGLSGRELGFFKSYLTNRKQYVQINSCKSLMECVNCGVPQGSVLGPLLFKIYINDLNNIGLKGKVIMYADDLCVLYPYKSVTMLKDIIERDAMLITKFVKNNMLVLNANKTKFIRFRPHPHRDVECKIRINNIEIKEQETLKYLGVVLQNNMSWRVQIQHLRSSLAPVLGMMFKLKNKLRRETKLLMFESLIQNKLKYLSHIYGYKPNSDLKSLQIIQNKALRCVYNLPRMFSTVPLYRDVSKTALPIVGLHKFQLLTYVYKCLNNIGHHTVQLQRNNHTFNTRHNSDLLPSRCRLEITKQRIEHIGVLEYNKLPINIKNSETISIFKNRLKQYLLENIEMLLL